MVKGHLLRKKSDASRSGGKTITIFIFYLSWCHENMILHLHSASWPKMRSIQFAIFTQLSQNLCWLHGVSPHIVTMAT